MITDLGLIPTQESNHCKCWTEAENLCLSPIKVKRKSVKAKIAAKRPGKK